MILEGTFQFEPSKRLHFPWEYRRFFGQAEVFRLSECTVFRIPNQLGHFRVGISIKARPGSVMRNQIKRAIRESFRSVQGNLGSFDYNVVITGARRINYRYPRRLGECLRDELILGKPI
jgi:ribonuclease P protein component